MSGWIKLYRTLAIHNIWIEKPFSRGQAWVDILLMVNYEPSKTAFGGKSVSVGRGSTITSIRALGDRWGWSRTKVMAFLSLLESEKMLSRKSDNKKTLLTVANYSAFQDLSDTEEPQKSRRKDTEKTQKSRTPYYKKEKKNIYAHFDAFWDAYPRKVSKEAARKAWTKLQPSNSLFEQIMSGLESAKRLLDWDKTDSKFIPYPATWLNQRRWEDGGPQPSDTINWDEVKM